MSEENAGSPEAEAKEAGDAAEKKGPRGPNKTAPQVDREKLSRKTLRALGRKKRKLKISTDREFATAYFAAKSKRSDDKKKAFRKGSAAK